MKSRPGIVYTGVRGISGRNGNGCSCIGLTSAIFIRTLVIPTGLYAIPGRGRVQTVYKKDDVLLQANSLYRLWSRLGINLSWSSMHTRKRSMWSTRMGMYANKSTNSEAQ